MLRWYSQWIASRFGWVTNIDHRTLAPIEFAQSHLSGGRSCLGRFHLILSPFVCLVTVQGTSKGCRVFKLGMQAICLTFKVFLPSAAILGILDDVLYLAIMPVAGNHTPLRNPESMMRRKVV